MDKDELAKAEVIQQASEAGLGEQIAHTIKCKDVKQIVNLRKLMELCIYKRYKFSNNALFAYEPYYEVRTKHGLLKVGVKHKTLTHITWKNLAGLAEKNTKKQIDGVLEILLMFDGQMDRKLTGNNLTLHEDMLTYICATHGIEKEKYVG